mgnify:CR=1 FL=1
MNLSSHLLYVAAAACKWITYESRPDSLRVTADWLWSLGQWNWLDSHILTPCSNFTLLLLSLPLTLSPLSLPLALPPSLSLFPPLPPSTIMWRIFVERVHDPDAGQEAGRWHQPSACYWRQRAAQIWERPTEDSPGPEVRACGVSWPVWLQCSPSQWYFTAWMACVKTV